MTDYAAAVSCMFIFIGNVFKVYYRQRYLLTMIITGYIRQITSLIL